MHQMSHLMSHQTSLICNYISDKSLIWCARCVTYKWPYAYFYGQVSTKHLDPGNTRPAWVKSACAATHPALLVPLRSEGTVSFSLVLQGKSGNHQNSVLVITTVRAPAGIHITGVRNNPPPSRQIQEFRFPPAWKIEGGGLFQHRRSVWLAGPEGDILGFWPLKNLHFRQVL